MYKQNPAPLGWVEQVACVALACTAGCGTVWVAPIGFPIAKEGLMRSEENMEAPEWSFAKEHDPQHRLFYGPTAEAQAVIRYGRRTVPFGRDLLRRFNPRLRCQGLHILRANLGGDALREVLVDQLDDPHEGIRQACLQWLREDFGITDVAMEEGMPIGKWIELRRRLLQPSTHKANESGAPSFESE